MPDTSNHRIGLVRVALGGSTSMRMDVSNDSQVPFPASGPKAGESIAVQDTYSRIVSTRVQIIVKKYILHLKTPSLLNPEKEDTRFMATLTAAIEL